MGLGLVFRSSMFCTPEIRRQPLSFWPRTVASRHALGIPRYKGFDDLASSIRGEGMAYFIAAAATPGDEGLHVSEDRERALWCKLGRSP